jgi:predicted cupin superfamily sugar epimerase
MNDEAKENERLRRFIRDCVLDVHNPGGYYANRNLREEARNVLGVKEVGREVA